MLKKYLLLIPMCLTLIFPLTSHATTLSDIASEASSSEEEENSAYFSDDEFEEFFTITAEILAQCVNYMH